MSYEYEKERETLFTDEGQKKFLAVRDRVDALLIKSGAVMLEKAVQNIGGDSWMLLACIDRLVELKEIREIPTDGATQYKVYVRR